MPKDSPLEGYFVCGGGGKGILMTAECLGQELESRTANYPLAIGLPQLDRRRVLSPRWTHTPRYEDERESDFYNERDPGFWGRTPPSPERALDLGAIADFAYIFRCRFYTLLPASTDEEFEAAARDFVNELEDWRMHFTSWVGIVTSQDLIGLAGYAGASNIEPSISTWTRSADGQRSRSETWLPYIRLNPTGKRPLELHDLQACLTATGNQGAPPAEWLFIRDARSLLYGGQNRRAVIDAAMAAELAIATLIDKHLAAANTDETVRTALLERHSTLGGRAALLRRLRPKLLSHQLGRDLIEPRNRATHRGHQLTDEQAQQAVDMAVDVVEAAYPLASLLPTA